MTLHRRGPRVRWCGSRRRMSSGCIGPFVWETLEILLFLFGWTSGHPGARPLYSKRLLRMRGVSLQGSWLPVSRSRTEHNRSLAMCLYRNNPRAIVSNMSMALVESYDDVPVESISNRKDRRPSQRTRRRLLQGRLPMRRRRS